MILRKSNIIILITIILIFLLSFSSYACLKKNVSITWGGHACFTIENSIGTKIVTDPFGEIGYELPDLTADILTISHNHFDHNNVSIVKGNYELINEIGKYSVENIKIKGIESYHDKNQGNDRGMNNIYTYKVDGIKICHLGDLGHNLSHEKIKEIGKVDVLLIPVGGYYTMDVDDAVKVANNLKPKIIIPMHYKVPGLNKAFDPLSTYEDFVNKMPGWKVKENISELKINKWNLYKSKGIYIMNY